MYRNGYGPRIPLNVDQRHIDEGDQGSRGNCAIARSLKEKTGSHRVAVGYGGAYVDHQRYDIGHEGNDFVMKFDKDKSLVSPIQLTLSPFFPDAMSVNHYEHETYMHAKYMAYKAQQGMWVNVDAPQWKVATIGYDFGV